MSGGSLTIWSLLTLAFIYVLKISVCGNIFTKQLKRPALTRAGLE
ncbi:GlyGly-CTERM sorting domain-containing protein [Cytobacillus spongiae]